MTEGCEGDMGWERRNVLDGNSAQQGKDYRRSQKLRNSNRATQQEKRSKEAYYL